MGIIAMMCYYHFKTEKETWLQNLYLALCGIATVLDLLISLHMFCGK